MEKRKGWVWVRRVAVGLVVVLLVVAAGVTWRMMDIIESELLRPGPLSDPVSLEIVGIAGSRVTFADDDAAAIDGVWGIAGDDGYGQFTRVMSRSTRGVERGLAVLSGGFSAGETVVLEANAFPDDPRTAHGLPFEEVRVPGELGVNPAWLIGGESETWVVFVHGKDMNGRAQSLRSLPTFRKLGMPVLVITYRNDASGGAGDDGHTTWGLDEWRDLESALATATLRGADDFILVGHDMGASIVTTFLHESDRTPDVRGVVLDSAVLDFEALVDDVGDDRLDQLERVDEFDPMIPMLLLHGTADTISPIETADAFAAALPHVEYERFSGAGHGALWNSQPVRYEEILTDFLISAIPELATDE
jgi:pimeloyl-ACP methyl ester carboxylesterase